VLRAAFVRTVGERDRIYVTRSDGSRTSWPFPTYGDGLPHDLVHLVVESAFGLAGGFWGRVDAGADPKRITDQANRKGGPNKYAAYGPDQRELLVAEALAAARWSERGAEVLEAASAAFGSAGLPPPADLTADRVERTAQVLAGLAGRWRALRPKGALDVDFDGAAPRRGFDRLRHDLAVEPTAAAPAPSREVP
jgi:hypothetical protein